MRYILILAILFSTKAQSQCREFIIGMNGDTLNCVDMKGLKQGKWVIKVPDLRGERGYEEEGEFKDGNKEGVWRRYNLVGDLIALENYRWGYKDGRNYYFTYQGQPQREETWRAIDPKNPYDTVDVIDPNDQSKILRKEIVKLEPTSYKHGVWRYFDPRTGAVEETVEWHLNRRKDEMLAEAQGDDLAPIDVADNTKANEPKKELTKPKEVLDFEKKNAGKKKVKVRDGRTGG
jgi:hypothetical protein